MTREALSDLLETVEAAIEAGDWKVDGACEPDLVIRRAKQALTQPEPVRIKGFDCFCGRRMVVSAEQGVIPAPERKWVGLTNEERQDIALEVPIDAVLITEAILKGLNT